MGVGIHLALRFPILSQQFFLHLGESTLFGGLLAPLLIEALRRATGMALVSVLALFIGMPSSPTMCPASSRAWRWPVTILPFLAIDSTAIFGTPLQVVATIVIVFIFFGHLLTVTGGSRWFTDVATALVGRSRGGSAKIAIVASAFFGSISGSAVANVVSTGIMTIPLMKRAGFRRAPPPPLRPWPRPAGRSCRR